MSFYLFGKSQSEILNLIKDVEMRTKMTREEALKKVGINNGSLLNHLEALGLIKFDEPNYDLTETIYYARRDTGCGSIDDQSKFIKYLNDRGYEIVKKS